MRAEIANPEIKETLPVSVDEISSKLNDFRNEERQFYGRNMAPEEQIAAITKTRNAQVEQLLSERARFKRIFKTSNGSIYFQLETGECARVKNISNKSEFDQGEGVHYKFQPLTTDLVFISQAETEKILNGMRNRQGMRPRDKIKTTDFAEGAYPLELNLYNYGIKNIFKKEDRVLDLLGTSDRSDSYSSVRVEDRLEGPYHLGHPIAEIIK